MHLFQVCAATKCKGAEDPMKRNGKQVKHPRVRKVELSLEDQMFRILKQARIVSIGPNSFFHLPSRFGTELLKDQ